MSPQQIRHRPAFFFSGDEMYFCQRIAAARASAGSVRALERGKDTLRAELIGVMAEVAVSTYYDTEPEAWVYEGRGGPSYDLMVEGWALGIKGTDRFARPTLIVRDYDISNDLYFLVSACPDGAHATIQGYATKEEILLKEPEAFFNGARPSRNVPFEELRLLLEETPAATAATSAGSRSEAKGEI